MSKYLARLSQQEQLNFLLTNRIPRRLVTRFLGWFSRIKSKKLTRISLAVWRHFAGDLNLQESSKQSFDSLQDCFIRTLKDDARRIDSRKNIVVSPCDAIIGAFGKVEGETVYQAKGYPYDLSELIPQKSIREKYHNGLFITLRLTSTMYHRFHAPLKCQVNQVNYISGDTWNVNPIALKRIEKLYCKNERAILDLAIDVAEHHLALVPVAAILVASMKFHCIAQTLDLKYRGEHNIACSASYQKGQEMGYFQHGSTIILFASGQFKLLDHIQSDQRINMGEALFHY